MSMYGMSFCYSILSRLICAALSLASCSYASLSSCSFILFRYLALKQRLMQQPKIGNNLFMGVPAKGWSDCILSRASSIYLENWKCGQTYFFLVKDCSVRINWLKRKKLVNKTFGLLTKRLCYIWNIGRWDRLCSFHLKSSLSGFPL